MRTSSIRSLKHSGSRRVAALLAVLVLFGMAVPSRAEAPDITIQVILDGMGEMRPIPHTPYLLVRSTENGLWGVYDTSGERRMEDLMHDPSYVGYGCFSDQRLSGPEDPKDPYEGLFAVEYSDEPVIDTVNDQALAVIQGSFVSDYAYGVIRALNAWWALGLVVSEATEEAYDIQADEETFYRIERCDVFALSNDTQRVASLEGSQFGEAEAHGTYLSVADRSGAVTVYDTAFLPLEVAVERVTDDVYGVMDYAAVDKGNREIILDGLTASEELPSGEDLVLKVTRTDFDGTTTTGLCTLSGDWLLPAGSDIIVSVSGDYAVLERGGKLGLYSFSCQKMVLPFGYDGILPNEAGADPYLTYGYYTVLQEEELSMISAADGQIVSSRAYDPTENRIGGTRYEQVSSHSITFTDAAGKSWRTMDMTLVPTRGDGRLIVMRENVSGLYGIYTMSGDTALDFKYKNQPVITDDGKVVLNTVHDGYQLMELDFYYPVEP